MDCALDPDVCGRAADCVTRDVWVELGAAMEASLRLHTLAELADRVRAREGNGTAYVI